MHTAAQVVLALGPWSRDFLREALGVSVPMAYERGYHMHYDAAAGATLGRPVYDTAGAYAPSPMAQGLRLTTGVQPARATRPPTWYSCNWPSARRGSVSHRTPP